MMMMMMMTAAAQLPYTLLNTKHLLFERKRKSDIHCTQQHNEKICCTMQYYSECLKKTLNKYKQKNLYMRMLSLYAFSISTNFIILYYKPNN